jgi:hypothetical protein
VEGGGGLDAGPGLPSLKEKSLLEPDRDGRDMMRDKEGPIQNVMREDQWPTACEDCHSIHIILWISEP